MAASSLRCRTAKSLNIIAFQCRSYNVQNQELRKQFLALPKLSSFDEYTDTPQYPPVEDFSWEAKLRRQREEYYTSVKDAPTVYEKLAIINEVGRKPTYVIHPKLNSHNMYRALQYYTKTCVFKTLPESLNLQQETPVNPEAKSLAQQQSIFSDIINVELSQVDREKTATYVNYRLSNGFSALQQYITYRSCDNETDDQRIQTSGRLCSFWFHDHILPSHLRFDKNKDIIHPGFQFRGISHLMLHSLQPLKEIVPITDNLVTGTDVPDFPYNPTCVGIKAQVLFRTSIAGYWPEKANFLRNPRLLINDTTRLWKKTMPEVSDEYLISLALQYGFAATNATAVNLGFSPYQELEQPIVCQHVTTDGQYFHLSIFQLNTTRLGEDFWSDNPRQNCCWVSDRLRLYETIEDGVIKGLDDSVLNLLFRFLNMETIPTSQIQTPYLNRSDAVFETEQFAEAKQTIKKTFENRLNIRDYLIKEIPAWAWIYKLHKHSPPSPAVRWQRYKQTNVY